MTQAERFSLATHLYVRLRRSSGRVVDAIWMAQNDEYAREILSLAATDPDQCLARRWHCAQQTHGFFYARLLHFMENSRSYAVIPEALSSNV